MKVFPHYDTRGKLFENVGSNHCYKPIALVIEDFDADGNVLSSMPLTFVGQVVDDKPENCVVEDDDDDQDDEDDEEYLSLDIEKQTAMLENFVTKPSDDGKIELSCHSRFSFYGLSIPLIIERLVTNGQILPRTLSQSYSVNFK